MDFFKILIMKIKCARNFFISVVSHRLKYVLLITFILLSSIFSLMSWSRKVDYVVLYDYLSDADSAWVISKLKDMHISYKFHNSTRTLLVPREKFDELRLSLISNNNILEKNNGFDLLDKEKWGLSPFREHINYYRGLEGELSKTLERIFPVQRARIHLVCKKDTDFFHNTDASSASIVVTLFPNTQLQQEQVDAIILLISSSVPHLSAENIVLVDQFGHILNKLDLNQIQFFKNHPHKQIYALEEYYINRINKILAPVYGIKNFIVNVSAAVHSHHINTKNANIENSDAKVFLEHLSKHKLQSFLFHNSFIKFFDLVKKSFLHFLTRFFGIDLIENKIVKYFSAKDNSAYSKQIMSVKYSHLLNFSSFVGEDKKTLKEAELAHTDDIIFSSGFKRADIKNLTVTILINYKRDNLGKLIPLSTQELLTIKKLVASVIGFSKARGDCINVTNYMFSSVVSAPHSFMFQKNDNRCIYYILGFFLFFGMSILFFLVRYQYDFSFFKTNNMSRSTNKLHIDKYDFLNKKNFFIKQNMLNKSPDIIEKVIRYWIRKK
ncbi:flagellar basal-body MS-ring/collar protein FliF [Buchnera aphidicola]|uniref:flagellar basal-body MS-ring/collar protein FliF n=1 Tax=Buchnera aphidicola TaxID=9 RepID=UPI00094DE8A9|nr:flagellar basal-body MS-ring/collar protein FliF [Buchnera aphidicola]